MPDAYAVPLIPAADPAGLEEVMQTHLAAAHEVGEADRYQFGFEAQKAAEKLYKELFKLRGDELARSVRAVAVQVSRLHEEWERLYEEHERDRNAEGHQIRPRDVSPVGKCQFVSRVLGR